jgi:hypothetical protein
MQDLDGLNFMGRTRWFVADSGASERRERTASNVTPRGDRVEECKAEDDSWHRGRNKVEIGAMNVQSRAFHS